MVVRGNVRERTKEKPNRFVQRDLFNLFWKKKTFNLIQSAHGRR